MIEQERGYLSALNEAPFTAADRMLVKHLREDWGEKNQWILLAAALCNLSIREGHAYFDLSTASPSVPFAATEWPTLEQWHGILSKSAACSTSDDTASSPLVLADRSSLYLEKYYTFERRLSELIAGRIESSSVSGEDPVDRASQSHFFVITGGPGTGKTTLALRYLDKLIESWDGPRAARFAAIAPTGKAAARLAESISGGVERMQVSEERKQELLSIPCLTIHRLLGALPHRSSFRANAQKPVRYDALVVDESSMIDLPLMMRLLEAVPHDCKLLLLGDKDQLTSVNVGSVFSDILDASGTEDSALSGRVERLSKTYRFSEDSGIFRACQLAREGNVKGFSEMLEEDLSDFEFSALSPQQSRIPQKALSRAFRHWESLYESESVESALAKLSRSMTLTPTRNGPNGSIEFNRRVLALAKKHLGHDPLQDRPLPASPIIVLENDYEVELFNGDVGLVWVDSHGSAFAYFQAADGGTRKVLISELPRFEPAFALTIHKSQGSEFDSVNCLFPAEPTSQVTRELVYTAFSRAKKSVSVFSSAEALLTAIKTQANRATRLVNLLRT
ncbi:exodeoxyribonuclease V subunit alpha [Pelagicoccus mobilis]|uniref:Exodeoxyribonuclease V subunit alpha n=1 Tax=Pelagicoccus mobilis TaxID=415221 RepID=A0A934RUT8_9BACT|nr:exodeoxyribonuclease V subunit alpha [Pelagicoccus mobilis]MBK1875835.1 exodeoxyribonuclease V subunit alpha [Pelagicoccus mobilis]